MAEHEILALAARRPTCPPEAIQLAREKLSDEAALERWTAATASEKKLDKMALYGSGLVFWAVTVTLSLSFYSEIGRGTFLLKGAMAIFAALCLALAAVLFMFFIFAKVSQKLGYEKVLKLLTPIAGTEYCATALKAINEGGALVAGWRDLALQERGQLYVFDVEVMDALRRVHSAMTVKAARKAELERACRLVHGLPTTAEA